MQQVLLYAAAVTETEGEQPERARLLYLGQRILDITVTDRKVEEATGHLANTWSGIRSACNGDDFEANPGVLCGWCPFATECPEGHAELVRRQAAGKLPAHAPAKVLVA